jgi:hypothetical protein
LEGQVALALAAGIAAFTIHGFWDALTWQHGAFMLMGVLLGLGASMCRLAASDSSATPAPRGA